MTRAVALLPAAGRARRLPGIPGSKEILPLPNGAAGDLTTLDRLLDQLGATGFERALIVLREGKWDIPRHLAGRDRGPEIAYRVLRDSASVPETLTHGLDYLQDLPVLLAFPDILYRPADLFRRLVGELGRGADLVLALLPTDRPDKSDMVELDEAGRPRAIVIKSARTDLQWAWGAAAWGPAFSHLVRRAARTDRPPETPELHIGHVVQTAIDDGLDVRTVQFPDGLFLDVGTPEDLARARALLAEAP